MERTWALQAGEQLLEGAGEKVLFGGGDPTLPGLVPSDIEIRGNHLAKPLAWRGSSWTIKNLFELKNARRLLIEGNVFEYSWGAAQDGAAIVLKSANEDNRAVVRHGGRHLRPQHRAPQRLGDPDRRPRPHRPTGQTARLLIRDNLLHDIDGMRWGGDGRIFTLLEDIVDLTIDHNTADGAGNALITADGELPAAGFVFSNNIGPRNEFGIKGGGSGEGLSTLHDYFPGYVFEANAIVGAPATSYPPRNFFPPTMDAVGFVDRTRSDYRLAASSPFQNAGTDGRPLGADIEALDAAVARAVADGSSEADAPAQPRRKAADIPPGRWPRTKARKGAAAAIRATSSAVFRRIERTGTSAGIARDTR